MFNLKMLANILIYLLTGIWTHPKNDVIISFRIVLLKLASLYTRTVSDAFLLAEIRFRKNVGQTCYIPSNDTSNDQI